MKATTTQTDTIRLTSNGLVYTPGIIAMAINEHAFKKEWSIDLLMQCYGLTKQCAIDLLTGKVKHKIEAECVVFEYPAGKARREVTP